jgi:hypothetical protein
MLTGRVGLNFLGTPFRPNTLQKDFVKIILCLFKPAAVSNVKRIFATNVATGTSLSPHLLKIYYEKYWQGIFFQNFYRLTSFQTVSHSNYFKLDFLLHM